jgi:hypothetical protein
MICTSVLNHVLYSEVIILNSSALYCLITNTQNHTDDMFGLVYIIRLQFWPRSKHIEPPCSEPETPPSHSKYLASGSLPDPDESNAHRYTLFHNYVPNQLIISFDVPVSWVLCIPLKFENLQECIFVLQEPQLAIREQTLMEQSSGLHNVAPRAHEFRLIILIPIIRFVLLRNWQLFSTSTAPSPAAKPLLFKARLSLLENSNSNSNQFCRCLHQSKFCHSLEQLHRLSNHM